MVAFVGVTTKVAGLSMYTELRNETHFRFTDTTEKYEMLHSNLKLVRKTI